MNSQDKGMILPTQHLSCSRFKSSFIPKNHHTWDFQLLIAHKQNPYTVINQLAVTAMRVSQPGVQMYVASVAVQSMQTGFRGLHERLLWLVHPSGLTWTHIMHVVRQKLQKTFHLQYGTENQWLSQQMCKCLATGGIALCLHAVQQCGCKIVQWERKWSLWWLCYTIW